jgi:hypothetical protein
MKSLKEYIFERGWDEYQQNTYPDNLIKDAVYDYVSGCTSGVNDELRKGNIKGSKQVISKLDKAFINKEIINVYRTVDWDYMNNIYKCNKDNIDEFINKSFINKGYMSTSSILISPWGKQWSDYELILHIVSKKPYPCININKIFNPDEIDCEDQEEILLPRNTKLNLLSYEIKNNKDDKRYPKIGIYILELEII